MAVKRFIRNFIRRAGYELLHTSSNAMHGSLLDTYNELRLNPNDQWSKIHLLPRLASLHHLGETLRRNAIDLLIDVGANEGQFALSARRTGYQGEIISFEPLSAHQEKLRSLSAKDGNWSVYPFALGSEASEASLNVYREDSFSSFHEINDNAKQIFGALVELSHVECVQVRTFDELCGEIGIDPKRKIFIKTDTQGHDIDVLRGATSALTNIAGVLSEATVDSLYDGSSNLDEIQQFLVAFGYKLGGMFPISYSPESLSLIELDTYFVRPE